MRIALVTCSKLPAWDVDDRPLHLALRDRGVAVLQRAWDDACLDWSVCGAVLLRTTWDYQHRRDEFLTWARRSASAASRYARADFLRDGCRHLRLSELELVEPSLFFRHGPGAANRLAGARLRRVACR
jgi:hypothetical protein